MICGAGQDHLAGPRIQFPGRIRRRRRIPYRLHTAMPLNVVGGNGGGDEHTAYIGMGGEF
jgi:hypothetical protein